MRKIFSILFILISLSFISCSKAPFSEKEPQSTIANVYVYALLDEEASSADNQASFKVYVNKKNTGIVLKDNEYRMFEFKKGKVSISVVRNDIEASTLELNIVGGESYFLKAESHSETLHDFTFKQIDKEVALGVIQGTSLAGQQEKNVEDDGVFSKLLFGNDKSFDKSKISEKEIDSIIEKKLKKMNVVKPTQVSSSQSTVTNTKTGSKLDDIRQAFEMKKQGLLSEEEFKAMKAEILAK